MDFPMHLDGERVGERWGVKTERLRGVMEMVDGT